jgi:dephospho-CoA kinase
VLAFAGRIGSGKSSISRAIAAKLHWPCVSFGDYVREFSRLHGLGNDRITLQDIGASLIQDLGWDQFCLVVLAQADWDPGESLIIDGIRHSEAVYTLRRLVAPSSLVLVYIDVDEAIQERRLENRGTKHSGDLRRIEAHPTERQVATLAEIADLIVDGGKTLEQLVREITDWAEQLHHG